MKITGSAKLTYTSRKLISEMMLAKGQEFIGSSLLLKEAQGKSSYVQIYLLLQGIEIICKGLLLLKDYDEYNRKVLRFKYGHDIKKLIKQVKSEYGIKNICLGFDRELDHLLTSGDWIGLRYAGSIDIFHAPETYETSFLYKKVYQTLKFIFSKKLNGG